MTQVFAGQAAAVAVGVVVISLDKNVRFSVAVQRKIWKVLKGKVG